MPEHAAVTTAPPLSVWVTVGGTLYELSSGCPDSWPYSSAIFALWQNGDGGHTAAEPIVLHQLVTGLDFRFYGRGSKDEPLYCPELQDRVPQCRCLTDGENTRPGSAPKRPAVYPLTTVHLPGDGPTL
jgi:hypothetical protein